MARYNQVDSQGIGESGFESEQWDRFERLRKLATDVELHQLTDYPNAVVRCYAFHAIALRKDTAIFSILLSHLKDTATVKTLSNDLGGRDMVGDYFVNIVTPQYIDLKAYKLSEDQKERLDSILLYDKGIQSGAKDEMLRQLKPNKRYYERVKEIAQIENNGDGLIALSKFRNSIDTGIIISYLKNAKEIYYGLYAAKEFPSPAFYSQLVWIFEDQWAKKSYYSSAWRLLYQALTQYSTSQTRALFERTIQTKDDYRRQTLGVNLLVALTKYPNSYFDDLKAQIKLDDYHKTEFLEELDFNK
ncbi:MAG: hypothetical protein ACXVAZ_06925 [Mucilaginibacter sp.]